MVKYQILIVCACLIWLTNAEYRIGVGRADVTGPSAEVPFMGYARPDQKGSGIHLRQFARTFIIEDGTDRVVFVSVDSCMISDAIRRQVLSKLSKRFGDIYNNVNLIISGIHTHSTPGGFLMDFLYDISTYGFVKETFNGLVSGITLSIIRAHNSITTGRIFVSIDEILDANINRSPIAYLNNPEEERDRYKYNVDKEIVQMKFVASNDSRLLGAINWFAVHPTSMNFTNRLVSSDNVGYASILLEKHFNKGYLTGKGPFVGAFASTNLGDVSPNIRGPRCLKSGQVCDILTSRCRSNGDMCVASGPGVDIFDSTKIIANRIYSKAKDLLSVETATEITGPLKTIHQFVNMTEQKVNVTNPVTGSVYEARGCFPAMGYSFAAGTTDGPGPLFGQGQVTPNELWNFIRDKIAPPTPEDVECHGRKPIFIATGRMSYPYQWEPNIVSTQLAMIGSFAIAAVPGEFTTMSGRRLRDTIKQTLIDGGALVNSTRVVVAGLSNAYSSYIATPEEYQIQRYEGASTIYGPFTLSIYLEQYKKLAAALMNGESIPAGPTPPDLSNQVISLLPPVIVDIAPWRKDFGDCVQQPSKFYKPGDVAIAKFVSGHPRNNQMHEGSFLAIEKKNEYNDDWIVIATDADWETRFIWHRKNAFIGTSEAEIQWDITSDVEPGEYRIRHYGNYKHIHSGIFSYQGLSNSFEVI